MALIDVDKVTYGYARQPVLREVTLSVASGEVISLLGPNGSGKTTLLKLLLGLLRPQSGRVLLEGRTVATMSAKQLARRMAYVPQMHRPPFGYQVLDVVMMGRMPHKPFFFRYSRTDQHMAHEALERLAIGHLAERSYTETSGGERQLILIARALAQGADIFVMDEPVNGLDYGNQIRLLASIANLAGSGFTFIKTTHFPDHALWIADRVVMIEAGRIVADGPAVEVVTRNNLFRLYHTPVDVVGLACGGHICVPEAVGRLGGRADALKLERSIGDSTNAENKFKTDNASVSIF